MTSSSPFGIQQGRVAGVSTKLSHHLRPSPVFIALCAALVAFGFALHTGNDLGGTATFLFVVVGWILSLTLHEFGHALVAFVSGDVSVAAKGYLTLDVRRYADLSTSVIFPVVVLLIGGIGLPGGAVWINHGLIPSKLNRSFVSLAGPAMSLICALICLAPIRFGLFDSASAPLAVAIGFLGWIQVIAFILNMLPIPGLDGFGAIEPFLSQQMQRAILPLRSYGMMILFFAILFLPVVRDQFWALTDWASKALGGETINVARYLGWQEFRFWA